MAEASAGRILIMAVGNYNAATPYAPLDLVAYNDESWLCRKACTGVTPTAQASEYWQKFGSAVGIATVSSTGIVRPDGASIKIIADGTISVPTATSEALGLVKPDGTTITIDANGTLTAQAVGALNDLTDVNISSATQGQILQYNVTSHKWENVTKQFLTELAQMADVDIDDSTLADGQALIYDVATGKWQNKTITQYPKLDTVEQVMANTQSGKVADALAVKTINASLGDVKFQIDSVNNKGQYSIDGGSTWQNFSGASSLIAFGDATTTYTFDDNYSSIMVVVFCTSANPQSTQNMHWIYPNVTSNDITLNSTTIKAPSFITAAGSYVNNSVTLYEGANVESGDQINLAYAANGNPQTKSFVYAIFGG